MKKEIEAGKEYALILPYGVSTNSYWIPITTKYNRSRLVLSNEGRKLKQEIRWKYNHILPTLDDVELQIIICPRRTKSGLADKRLVDVDNFDKGILDSLTGILYKDDRQIKDRRGRYGRPVPNGRVVVIAKKYFPSEPLYSPALENIFEKLIKGEYI